MDLLTRARTLALLSLIATPPLLGVVPGWVSVAAVPLAVAVHLVGIQLLWLVGRARSPTPRVPMRLAWYDGALALFLLLMAVSLRQAIEPLASLEVLVWWGGGVYLYFQLPRLLARPGDVEIVYAALVGAAAFAAAFSLPAVLEGGAELCGSCSPVIQHHRNLTALYLLPGFFLALRGIGAARGRLGSAAYALALLAIGSFLVFSRCRAAWVAIPPALAYLALARRGAGRRTDRARRSLRRRAGLAAAVGALALAAAVALVPAARDTLSESRLLRTASTLLHPTEGSAGGRLQLWRAGTALVGDHPAWGVGLAHWKERFHPYRNAFGPAPHETYVPLNSFLRLAGEVGLLATALFGVFVVGILAGVRGRSFEARSLEAAVATMLFGACFHVTLYDPPLLGMLWLTLALLRRHDPGGAPVVLPRPWALTAGFGVLVLLLGATALEARFTKAQVYAYILGPFVDYASGTAKVQAPGIYARILPHLGGLTADLAYREHAPALRRLGRLNHGSWTSIHETLAAKEHGAGALAEALGWAEAARARSPEDPRAHAQLCEIQHDLGRLAEAASSCRRALELDPYAPEPSHTLAAIEEAGGAGPSALATRLATRARYERKIAGHLGQASLLEDVARWYEGRAANERALRALRARLGVAATATETLTAIAHAPSYNKSLVTDGSTLWFSGTASGAFGLWSLDLASGHTRLASNDELGYFRLRRPGEGAALLFVSDRDGDYRYALFARDSQRDGSRQLTSRAWGASVAEFEPSPDGAYVAYKMERGRAEDLFLLDTATLRAERITRGARRIADLAWAPSSTGLAFAQDESRLAYYDVRGRRLETLFEAPGRELRWPAFTPSGRRLAFVVRDALERSAIWELDLDGGPPVTLTDEDEAYFMSLGWLDEDRLLYRRQVHDAYGLGMLTRSSRELAPLGPSDGVVYEYVPGPDRETLYFFYGDARTPISLHRLHLGSGALEQLVDQAGLADESIVEHRTHRVEAKGATLRVYVYTPPDAAPGERHPCVIWLGGSGGYSPRWNPYTQYLAKAGFVVAAFNYSGLPGSPRRVLETTPQQADAVHVEELAAVQRLLAGLPEADASRTALVGVSRGARVVEAGLLGEPGLFRAGVELAGPPTDLLDAARPGLAPLLFVLGANDAYVPVARKEAQATVQRAAGNSVEVLVLEGEGHDLRRGSSVQAALERTVAFLRAALGPDGR